MSEDGAKPIKAAGTLIWRERRGQFEVLAIHRPRYDDWSWPKGKLDKGETTPGCAIRETKEETGIDVVLGKPLPTLRYLVANGKIKEVHYWAAQVAKPTAHYLLARDEYKVGHNDEVDEMRWLSVAEAERLISFADDLKPLRALVRARDNGTLVTRALVLVRHARARRRKAWRRSDQLRPLTRNGSARALGLVPFFSAFGVKSVTSSPAKRCTSTVQPYADAIGTDLVTFDELTEENHASRPLKTAERFQKLIKKPSARVVSVHRPTLPTIMAILRSVTRKSTQGSLPTKNPYLPAGGAIVAHVVDTESGPLVVSVETHALKA